MKIMSSLILVVIFCLLVVNINGLETLTAQPSDVTHLSVGEAIKFENTLYGDDKYDNVFSVNNVTTVCPPDLCAEFIFSTTTDETFFALTLSKGQQENTFTLLKVTNFTNTKEFKKTVFNIRVPTWVERENILTMFTPKAEDHEHLYFLLKNEQVYKLYKLKKDDLDEEEAADINLVMDINPKQTLSITSNIRVMEKEGRCFFYGLLNNEPVLYQINLENVNYPMQLTFFSKSDPLVQGTYVTRLALDRTNNSVVLGGRFVDGAIHYPVIIFYNTMSGDYKLYKFDLQDYKILGLDVDELHFAGQIYALVSPSQAPGVDTKEIKLIRLNIFNNSISSVYTFNDPQLDILFSMRFVFSQATENNPSFSSIVFSYRSKSDENELLLAEYIIENDGTYTQKNIALRFPSQITNGPFTTFTYQQRTYLSLIAQYADTEQTNLYSIHVMPDLQPEKFHLPDWIVILVVSIIVAIEYVAIIGCLLGSKFLKRIRQRNSDPLVDNEEKSDVIISLDSPKS